MILKEIKEIAKTWFEWPNERREYVTYTSAILFALAMYERGQTAERERIKQIVDDVGWKVKHDAWLDCLDVIMERIEQ